jgi:hypothetical protein
MIQIRPSAVSALLAFSALYLTSCSVADQAWLKSQKRLYRSLSLPVSPGIGPSASGKSVREDIQPSYRTPRSVPPKTMPMRSSADPVISVPKPKPSALPAFQD